MSSAKIRLKNGVCTVHIGGHVLPGTVNAKIYFEVQLSTAKFKPIGEAELELGVNLKRKKNGFYLGTDLFCSLPKDDDFDHIERRLKKIVQLIYERGWELRCAKQVYGSQPEVGIEG